MEISINKLADGINAKSHRKENSFYKSLQIVAYDPANKKEYSNGFSTPLDVRFYGSGSTVYCCIWGSVNGQHFNGSSKAGGYGYDKESSAFAGALEKAGFNVSGLSASGENESAINQIAKLMSLETYTIVRSHA